MNKLHKSTTIYALVLIATLLFGYSIRNFVVSIRMVEGNSMLPTLRDGDLVLVNMWSKNFEVGNIIIFNNRQNKNSALIKRIVSSSNSEVYIDNFRVFVNNQQLAESNLYKVIWDKNALECRFSEVLNSKNDEFLVLGDNRCNSADSRFFGSVPRKNIIGKLIFSIKLSELKSLKL